MVSTFTRDKSMDYKTIIGFNGINRNVSPFLVETGDLSEAQNFSGDKIGVLKKSFDYTIKGSQIASGYDVIGGTDFFRNDGTHDHFVAVDGATIADIYEYDTDWSSFSQNLTAGYRVRFAYSPTIDYLFAVNYADATRSYNGIAWSTSTNVTSAPRGKYIIGWGDRIYILNCSVSGTAYPSRAYRSDAIETSVTWDTDEYIQFEDTITGVSTIGETLFVACQNSTYIFTLSDEKFKVSSVGCVSHESIVPHTRYTFYAAVDGYYAFDGRDTVKVSAPIQQYWDQIPVANLDDIRAVAKGDHVYVYIGDIAAPWDSNETLQNVMFDYNVLQNNWHRAKLGNDCTDLHTYTTTTGRDVFFGDDDGNVYAMFDDSGQQNSTNYTSFLETHWIYGSSAGVMDDFRELWGYGQYLSGLKVSYKTEEREDWKEIGELNQDSDLVKFKIRAYKIKFRLAEVSGENLFELERLDVGYTPAYERDEDRTR